jgi:hypothetical protein
MLCVKELPPTESRFMPNLQRFSTDAVWSLGRGASTTLALRAPRVLQVCEGRLWLTAEGSAERASADVWLLPGDTLALEPGARAVVEGWPTARFRLLVPPSACEAAPTLLARMRAWLGGLRAPRARRAVPAGPALRPGT